MPEVGHTSQRSVPVQPPLRRGDLEGPIPIMLLVSSLEYGGAERQVVELMRHIDRRRFDPVVCSLSDCVPLADRLPDVDRELVIVEKRWKFDVTTVTRTAEVARARSTRLLHAFLFDAEMVGRLAGRLARVPVVIGSERNADYNRRWLHSACLRATGPWANAVVANSNAGKRFLQRTLGLAAERVFVVRNGVDAEVFVPGPGVAVRDELGISHDELVVGMIANFKRQKNHGAFFEMANRVFAEHRNTWFLCVGEPLRDNLQGAEDYHREVRAQLDGLAVRDRVLVLGRRGDMPDVYRACDVTVLPSLHEGTPNVLLESMACGVPVVASDVADNREVVTDGETGYVVPRNDVDALVDRVSAMLSEGALRSRLGRQARAWAEGTYSTAAMADGMQAVYDRLLREARVVGDVRGG